MSYCRLSPDCDIYCYYHVGGYYEVWSGAGEHQFKTAKETVDFLRERRAAGDKVPDYVFENLSEEAMNEPIGWIYEDDEGRITFSQTEQHPPFWEPVYRARKQWQGLTDEEVEKIYLGSFDEGQFARAIEAKLKEKNA